MKGGQAFEDEDERDTALKGLNGATPRRWWFQFQAEVDHL